MKKKQLKPAWILLYAFIAIMFVGILLESVDGLPAWTNEAATIIIVFLIFGAMAVWVKANASAMLREELEGKHERLRVTVYAPKQQSATPNKEVHDQKITVSQIGYLHDNIL